MFRIRYYDQVIHPDQFEGRLGAVIRALNWLRWKLEVLVQSLVLRYIAKTNGATKDEKRSLLDAFRVDVQVEEIERDISSPKRVRAPRLSPEDRVVQKLDGPVQKLDKILESRSELPVRPGPLNELIGKYALSGRGQRYAHSQWAPPAEDQFGPMEED